MPTYLLDANFLLALTNESHVHSEIAVQWEREKSQAGSLAICRVVQMALARLQTNSLVLRDGANSPKEFWAAWDRLLGDPRFCLVAEPASLELVWRSMSEGLPPAMKLDTDTYLAAFAVAGGYTMVTFDKGFKKYPTLQTEILT